MNKIEKGFKRLASAAEPLSKTNKALLGEAKAAAEQIISFMIEEAETDDGWGVNGAWRRWQLPNRWSIQRRGGTEQRLCLVPSSDWDCPAVDDSPESARHFGLAMANGILIQFSKYLESRHQESTVNSKVLAAANKVLGKID